MTNLPQRHDGAPVDYDVSANDDPLSAARGFVNGFALACVFWLCIAGLALALGARPW